VISHYRIDHGKTDWSAVTNKRLAEHYREIKEKKNSVEILDEVRLGS
jgi:hypothetical protein